MDHPVIPQTDNSFIEKINKYREIISQFYIINPIYPIQSASLQEQLPKYTHDEQMQILDQVVHSNNQINETLLDIYNCLICEKCDGTGKKIFYEICSYCNGVGNIIEQLKTCKTCNSETLITRNYNSSKLFDCPIGFTRKITNRYPCICDSEMAKRGLDD